MAISLTQELDVGMQTNSITVDVVIEEDSLAEGIETFTVSLTHGGQVPYSVILDIATVNVVIIDNDSKPPALYHLCSIFNALYMILCSSILGRNRIYNHRIYCRGEHRTKQYNMYDESSGRRRQSN